MLQTKQINMKGLDGIQGPTYMGSACVFRRFTLYGSKRLSGTGRTCNCWPHQWCCGSCLSLRKKRKLKFSTTREKRAVFSVNDSLPNSEDEEGTQG